ncbi:membrane protease YdiL (CAAX protease family) [Paucibacter oligotrophus]|uniref:Membrane protease YdiL (CAAX protease family) n=1 Tax=Roseateles oligotrophus TaxID=1769250 RepID=A0A840LBY7_9BURK|nr:type II CAAX endopeptidase family protein [Roseateles oligotrophus]MBB4843698.1 membrane protease YdiL (CAAX protease family) [Roseateles oligotrophus]
MNSHSLPFGLLALAACSVWSPSLRLGNWRFAPWQPLLAAALLAAWVGGVLSLSALLILISFAAGVLYARGVEVPALSQGLICLIALAALALSVHLVPGIANPLVFAGTLHEGARPMKFYLNFDKGFVGVMLLAVFAQRGVAAFSSARTWASLGLIGVLTLAAVFGLAWGTGAIRFEPKWPPFAWTFLFANLFFVALAEEAFFRGLLQEQLARLLGRGSVWRVLLPIAFSAIFFGLAHGPAMAVLASVAGLGYALAYAASRNILAPTLLHFGVNTLHFGLFSYPSLLKS